MKNVAGCDRPTVLTVGEGCTRSALDPACAAALPMVVMTLLYPEEISATDIARVAGTKSDSAWRLEAEHEGRVFRVSRGFAPSSVLVEDQTPDGQWTRVAQGSSEARVHLTDLLRLPPPTITEALNFWLNPFPAVHDAIDAEAATVMIPDLDDGVALVGTDDYFGNLVQSGNPGNIVPLGEEERRLLADEYRRNRTIEFVDDQMRQAEAKLDSLLGEVGALIDGSGEHARITRELATLPTYREITSAEREALGDPDARLAEAERRLGTLEGEEAPARAGQRPLVRDPMFIGGVVATALFTGLSVVLDGPFRRFALLNVLSLGAVLFAALSELRAQGAVAKGDARAAARERRREALVRDLATLRATLAKLREEVPVRNLAEYDRVVARRAELAAELAEVERRHEVAFQSDEYRRLDAKRARAQELVDALRDARKRLGDPSVPGYELAHSLERGGVDPNVVLWRPDPPTAELSRQVKRLGQVASKYRLISEEGLNPKTVASWMRVAERIAGEGVPLLNLTAEHQLVTADGRPALEILDESHAVAVVQALRMSLHLTLVKARAAGIQPFAIDIFPERVPDPATRQRLAKMYTGLGERLQVLAISAA
ncbi:MAG: hypothetical protein H6698_07985 [Myxococcales bacterium]|nr:hypothetical protein [Myxococcales bacterium]MCB9534227.1 hypothetical protein [Myxococcales bacterium]